MLNFIKLICVPLVTTFVIISTVLLNKPTNIAIMIPMAMLLILSVALDRRFAWLRYIQFIFLGAFHYSSQLNWCLLLYYIIISNAIEYKVRLRDAIPISLLLILQYTLIRFTYLPMTTYNMLVSVFDMISAITIVLIFHIGLRIQSEKQELTKQNDYLENYDQLTGFYNYLGFKKQVQSHIDTNKEFLFVLFDINNFKSINAASNTPAKDILYNFSRTLMERFPNHLAASRYAGDRFSLLLTPSEKVEDLQIFEKLDFQVTVSVTRSPQESVDFLQLMQIGEERIFQKRGEYWLNKHEEQLRSDKMKMVGELAAGMAHEIRNPLTSIQGFIQLSKKTGYNIEPWYDVIMGEISRVGELTVDFLQFSKKTRASNMKVEKIANCMAKVYSLCESEARSCGHTIEMKVSDPNIMVLMDQDKIIQVLINLIRNAVQAMEQSGQVYFELSREGATAVVKVRDHGKGIPVSEINKIFDPFYTTKEEGTGLGLSLCQKIITDHEGHIKVESEVGSGTVFIVRLPIHIEDSI